MPPPTDSQRAYLPPPLMQTLLDRFDKKTPHYPNRYRDMIDKLSRKRAFDTSSGTEEE